MSFKNFLAEGKIELAPWHLRGQDLVDFVEWSTESLRQRAKINKNDTITLTRDIGLNAAHIKDKKIPFQISTAKDFGIETNELEDLWGCPSRCNRLTINSKALTSLQHLNCTITATGGGKGYAIFSTPNVVEFNCWLYGQELLFWQLKLTNFHNVHKFFDFERITLAVNGPGPFEDKPIIHSNALGFILMPRLKALGYEINTAPNNCYRALDIINQHLRDEKDLIDCKEDLMGAGLKEYAKL